eukprot:Ihof_evm17s23 gene=Ihof_evmTU17s23
MVAVKPVGTVGAGVVMETKSDFPQQDLDRILYDLLIPAEWTYETQERGGGDLVWTGDREKFIKILK